MIARLRLLQRSPRARDTTAPPSTTAPRSSSFNVARARGMRGHFTRMQSTPCPSFNVARVRGMRGGLQLLVAADTNTLQRSPRVRDARQLRRVVGGVEHASTWPA